MRGVARRNGDRFARSGILLILATALACGPSEPDDANIARGRRLPLASLATPAEAGVFDAAVRAAFDVGPGLTLLIHPRRLPRTAGYEGGDSVPAALVQTLRSRGIVAGVCEPQRDTPRNTPRCNSAVPGYIVRASDVFRISRDTVELYFSAERFGAATGARPEALRFEKIYQLVGSGTTWRVAREARVKDPER
jgi:hypothetical protein